MMSAVDTAFVLLLAGVSARAVWEYVRKWWKEEQSWVVAKAKFRYRMHKSKKREREILRDAMISAPLPLVMTGAEFKVSARRIEELVKELGKDV